MGAASLFHPDHFKIAQREKQILKNYARVLQTFYIHLIHRDVRSSGSLGVGPWPLLARFEGPGVSCMKAARVPWLSCPLWISLRFREKDVHRSVE